MFPGRGETRKIMSRVRTQRRCRDTSDNEVTYKGTHRQRGKVEWVLEGLPNLV